MSAGVPSAPASWKETLILAIVGVMCSAAWADSIVLVYPRADLAGSAFAYVDGLDSTFVLGRVEPPDGKLTINGCAVSCTERGAFLCWLPIRKSPRQESWDLRLTRAGAVTASLSFPYSFRSDLRETTTDAPPATLFPRVLRVTAAGAHTRTMLCGSYDLFPEAGSRLLATGWEDGAFRFDLGPGWWGTIEERFVTIEPDTALPPLTLRDGIVTQDGDEATCAFGLSMPVLWSPDVSEDGRSLRVILLGVRAATQRVQYLLGDAFVEDVEWRQRPEGTILQLRCRREISRGYEIEWADDSLRIRIRAPWPKRERSLKDKIVVLDPGHGGAATGAIGPLGTLEKDVNLTWARLLAFELQRKGALVRMTRTADEDAGLSARIQHARMERADMYLSLHCNALPDGENPIERHGTGTYYYQSRSRRAAEIVHRQLLQATGLRDDGVWDANLAVIRPTLFPALLLEPAYLISPPEEELLLSEAFLRRLSRAVVRALEDYFRTEP